ncbi:RNA polymerase factor sigma-54 [Candidatus Sulfidibacterium hydrothermale]|uniref:RNA polymerase factor sigma-54 n=1 Tax=Candidatus Sulfidibacterium hydrothermale TaxID=2875962 RepID=UPI001F0A2876|nr:RNA polymerase factor sigma-54 [Candidatus Sulfidibacterium hydrothermale]UBM62879.1 RNA polymerase factor sigma-54 [Candidatus Sulfidibacterium hydrothermale]
MLRQRLQQKLLQKLSPQQILLMKLLQIPANELEQRIKQEIEENPALEADTFENQSEDFEGNKAEESPDEPDIQESTDDLHDDFDVEDYYKSEDEIPEYKLQIDNRSRDEERKEIPFSTGISFHELLKQQLGMQHLDEKKRKIGEYIIGNIDDSGYLQRSVDAMVDDLAFMQNLEVKKEDVEEVLSIIQEFDPPGVGGRNLQECLLIQLKHKMKTEDSETLEIAYKILKRYFNEFTKKHYEKIMKRLNITEQQLKEALDVILSLNPKPGNSLGETSRTNQYIIPDFTITNNNGELELTLNTWNMPELRVSQTYSAMLNDLAKSKKRKAEKETFSFIKKKMDSAKWFIEAVKQRQNTLYITMKAIMDYQREYFLTGDETKLRPMILKDIADIVGMDVSTISRVANSKYVQTPFGTFLLKSFFSESMKKDDGEEVSTREVKTILKNLIENEDKKKPLTDEQLMKALREKGYPIARRTVAKYREQLGIPVARLRKELNN